MKLENLQQKLTDVLRQGDLHAAAELIVKARQNHFITADGSPDYGGRSYAYRQWFADAVNALNLPNKERMKLLGRLRFHAGNELRSVVPASELKSAGLLTVSPVQRGKQNYEQRSAPYRVLRGGRRITDADEVAEVCKVLSALAKRIDGRRLTDASRARLLDELTSLEQSINQ